MDLTWGGPGTFLKGRKKLFKPKGWVCTFCKKVDNHTRDFCPLRESDPPDIEIPFVINLLSMPKEVCPSKLNWAQARAALDARGGELNKGNPWASSTAPVDALRKRLGFWKAIGANNSVIS